MSGLLAFLLVAIVVIVTPGPDTALTIRNALAGGLHPGVRTAVGVACGQAVWALATSVGLAALLVASEPVFVGLKLFGAVYLIYLGCVSLLAAARRRARTEHRMPATSEHAMRQGLVSNLANPKMAVFFCSVLPQFGDSFPVLLALGLLFCALTLSWLTAYALVVAHAGEQLRRPRVRRALDAVTGTALVALGLRLASTSR